MKKDEIRIVSLSPQRVVCVHAFGQGPEEKAFDKMKAWAQSHGLTGTTYRVFGYNNPDPTPGSPNYGYDVWMTVDAAEQGDEEARLIEFPGGLYAVLRVEVASPWDDIPSAWGRLVKWMEQSKYQMGQHQYLEEHIGPLEDMGGGKPFTLDLHLPIRA